MCRPCKRVLGIWFYDPSVENASFPRYNAKFGFKLTSENSVADNAVQVRRFYYLTGQPRRYPARLRAP